MNPSVPETFNLWPGQPPHAVGTAAGDIPTLSIYRPPARQASGAAVIVLPGGGYNHLANHEGEPIAHWLNTLGVTGIVLRYRHGPRYRHPVPLLDAARAVRTVRHRAAEWQLDPQRIGIMGFSAGGHLASTVCTHFGEGDKKHADEVERLSSRPDLAILAYPVITLDGPSVHVGSRGNLLGENPSAELVRWLSNDTQVTPRTPPTFLFHTADDPGVPVENSLLYAMALRRCGVPVELHVFEHGRHGLGLAESEPAVRAWSSLCAAWLGQHGFAR